MADNGYSAGFGVFNNAFDFHSCVRSQQIEDERRELLAKMYADPNLAKMEYDCAVYDEETERLVTRAVGRNGQIAANAEADQQLSFLGAPDTEGIEEITGNYKP